MKAHLPMKISFFDFPFSPSPHLIPHFLEKIWEKKYETPEILPPTENHY